MLDLTLVHQFSASKLTDKTTLKGVVDKVFDAVETFHAHIRTQVSRLPQKIS